MTLNDILRDKGAAVHTIDPEATLDDVVQKLVRHNCGSLVVCAPAPGHDEGRMIGIITERDILKACAACKGPLEQYLVSEFMSRNVTTGALGDRVEEVMGVMTNQ